MIVDTSVVSVDPLLASSLLQETEIAVGGQCCRCAPELRCGLVRVARSMTSPVYWATITPRYGKLRILRFLRITPVTFTPVPYRAFYVVWPCSCFSERIDEYMKQFKAVQNTCRSKHSWILKSLVLLCLEDQTIPTSKLLLNIVLHIINWLSQKVH